MHPVKKTVKTVFKKCGIYKPFVRLCGLFAPSNGKKEATNEVLEIYSKFVRKNDVCFDVGANDGLITEGLLSLGAKVVSVEPQDSCLKLLREKFKNNANVSVVGKAASDHEGEDVISICEDAPTISTMSDKWKSKGRFSENYEWDATQKVEVTTLDKLIDQYGMPSFCKIDVEGYELSVLKGLTRPIPFISFEFTREFFNDAKACIEHILSINTQAMFNCTLHGTKDLLFADWVTRQELMRRLENEENKLYCGDIYAKLN
jgi:FkbM family methyltransferase